MSCEAERRIVGVPVVVEVVPVHNDLAVVLNQVWHIEILVVVPDDYIAHHQYHHPLKNLRIEFYVT